MLLRVRARAESGVAAGTSKAGGPPPGRRGTPAAPGAGAGGRGARKRAAALREEVSGGFGGVGWRQRRERVRRKVRKVAGLSLDTLDVLIRESPLFGKSFANGGDAAAAATAATEGEGDRGGSEFTASAHAVALSKSAASAVVRAPASALRLLVRQLQEETTLRWTRARAYTSSSSSSSSLAATPTPSPAARNSAAAAAATSTATTAPPTTTKLPLPAETPSVRVTLRGIGLRRKKISTMPRVFCVSDVHTDHPENMRWVQGLSKEDYRNDTLLLGGDISDSRDVLEKTLAAFRARFKHVFFVPGNHDLWLRRDAPSTTDSYDKLHELFDLCESLGVQTRPAKVDGVWIVPLLSWHHESFDTEPDIEGWKGIPSHRDAMMDFKLCRWPAQWNERDNESIVAKKLDMMNEELCSSASSWEYTLPEDCEGVSSWDELLHACRAAREAGEPVISFSHFLPHIELLPEKRMLFFPNLAKAVGSNYLKKRVETLAPTCHVFGHTHFAWDTTIRNTRYLQVPLAKPTERRVRMRSLAIGDIELEPLCVWKGEAFCDPHACHWSEFYKNNERDPYNTRELASWVERLYTKL